MKYITAIISAFALTLLASCSDKTADEPVAKQEMAFRGHCTGQSRTEGYEELSADYSMWVSALYTNSNSRLYLFKKSEFGLRGDNYWHGKDSEHGTDIDYYYPLEGKVDFFAFAKQTAAMPAFDTYPYNFSQDSKDYLYKATLNYAQGASFKEERWLDGKDDVLVADVVDNVPCGIVPDRNVDFKFKHILSNMRFTFTAETQEAEENFRVVRIEINNLYWTGQAVLERDARGDSWKPVVWENFKNYKQMVRDNLDITPKFVDENSTEEVQVPAVDFYLPVQPVSGAGGDQPTFSIYYVYQVGDDKTEVMNYMEEREFTFPMIEENGVNTARWEAGVRYTYNIMCKILPHIEFIVTYEEKDQNKGFVLDKWQNEDPIDL